MPTEAIGAAPKQYTLPPAKNLLDKATLEKIKKDRNIEKSVTESTGDAPFVKLQFEDENTVFYFTDENRNGVFDPKTEAYGVSRGSSEDYPNETERNVHINYGTRLSKDPKKPADPELNKNNSKSSFGIFRERFDLEPVDNHLSNI
jgi:hypothetical protein